MKDGKSYDVVLMDIEWKKERNGMDFAEDLHRLCPCTSIIYMTAYTMDFVEDAFLKTVNLGGFLTKPVKQEQLEKILKKIQQQNNAKEGVLVIRYKSIIRNIAYREILYLESDLHKVNIVLNNQVFQCNEQLSKLKERLNDQFVVCHKSYIVNMAHIKEFRYSEIEMNNGTVIPISKKRYAEAKKQFFKYVAERT